VSAGPSPWRAGNDEDKLNMNKAMQRYGLWLLVLLAEAAVIVFNAPPLFAGEWKTYRDPGGRFTFEYPGEWGTVSQGTDSGFEGKVAALRFADFSAGVRGGRLVLGGEAVLTRGAVQVDIQALGGLYDPITAQVVQPPMTRLIDKHLATLGPHNFCKQLAREDHIDWSHDDFAGLTPATLNAFQALDRTRNLNPEVIRCERSGGLVVFHKEATVKLGRQESRQHLYGAVRFLGGAFSSFQLVRGGLEPPGGGLLNAMARAVESFTAK